MSLVRCSRTKKDAEVSYPNLLPPRIRECILFVRIKRNCTLSLDFVDAALLRGFEDLKSIMLNPVDVFLILTKYIDRSVLIYNYLKNKPVKAMSNVS